jgi:hypothetical protein
MNIYYVYAYLRKSDNTPYYIGKGKGSRAFAPEHSVSVPKDHSKIIMLETGLTNLGACAIERRMIRWYGRKDLDTGILHNRTDGGEGAPGAVRSEELKKRISLTITGRSHPWASRPGDQNTFYGKKHTVESIEKQSTAKQGKNNPMFGRTQLKVCCIHCHKETSVNTLPIHHKH